MATIPNSKLQAKRTRAALKKLRATGLYTGKLDLRRKLTGYQKRQLSKFKDVIAGKSVALKPLNPKSYKGIFPIKRGVVIVPRRKGERILVEKKTGEIISSRKIGGVSVSARYEKVDSRKKRDPDAAYLVPFIRGRKTNGDPILEWKRFPNWNALQKVMAGYDYKNWKKFVVVERIKQ